ncbi:hypothetical protein CDS [Bradyrhizobium sp.]|nr:hypothetical protein CDS [Bradyrhizobium sp.]
MQTMKLLPERRRCETLRIDRLNANSERKFARFTATGAP